MYFKISIIAENVIVTIIATKNRPMTTCLGNLLEMSTPYLTPRIANSETVKI